MANPHRHAVSGGSGIDRRPFNCMFSAPFGGNMLYWRRWSCLLTLSMTQINQLLADIRNRNIVVPEFQREYVWSRDQAKQLIMSLFKEYPIGGLLLWRTGCPPQLKNIDTLPEKIGTVQVLLDGQQRLTTLYLLITGQIPNYYQNHEIFSDPRDLYINL